MPEPQTRLSFDGECVLLNGDPTLPGRRYRGTSLSGLLPNARMVQAVFDDETPDTVGQWAYPDTGEWDPDRNVTEFVDALPTYYDRGLRAVTVCLQGGRPSIGNRSNPERVSAFRPDGSLKAAWMDRLARVLDRADELGMVVIVGYFYFGQDDVFDDETAIRAATRNVTDWLLEHEYHNVIVEVNNECNHSLWDHDLFGPAQIPELIELVASCTRDGRRLPVGTSFGGGVVPTPDVIEASDVALLHGNGVDDPARIADMIAETRAITGENPIPIIFNEDDNHGFGSYPNNMAVALEHGASWGYYSGGRNDYRSGFQSPPVQWAITTPEKEAFFRYVEAITRPDAVFAEPDH